MAHGKTFWGLGVEMGSHRGQRPNVISRKKDGMNTAGFDAPREIESATA